MEYDDEDIQASKAPSLMQSMMEVNPEGDSDDELSEDETTTSASKTSEKKEEGETKKDK